MENIDINLENARLICSGKLKLYKEHKVNSFTSINISGYYKYIDLKDKSLLTIGNSSDEVFNGIFYGAKDITVVDDNPYTLYYYYLKLAAIYTLSYREFEWFFYRYVLNKHPNNKMFSKRLFKKIKPVLKELNLDAYNFFNELFMEFDHRIIRDKLFNDNGYHKKAIHGFDIYLRNDNTYNKTKRSLPNTNVNYQKGNILTDNVNGKHNIIDLSNICAKVSLNKMINLYDKLDKDNLDNDGIMILGYLWNHNMYTEEYLNVWKKIYQYPNSNKYLNKYYSEVLLVNGYRDFLWEQNNLDDKVLVYNKH